MVWQSGEEEWVRKVKNEFLVRLQEISEDGNTVYFIGATNTPQVPALQYVCPAPPTQKLKLK